MIVVSKGKSSIRQCGRHRSRYSRERCVPFFSPHHMASDGLSNRSHEQSGCNLCLPSNPVFGRAIPHSGRCLLGHAIHCTPCTPLICNRTVAWATRHVLSWIRATDELTYAHVTPWRCSDMVIALPKMTCRSEIGSIRRVDWSMDRFFFTILISLWR